MFGNYYCYDNPTALAKPLKAKLDMSNVQYNLLYSVYSLPNTVLPLLGGVFVDQIGVYKCLVIFMTCLCVGQSVFALAVSTESYWLAIVGRIIFVFGGESICVASSALLADWFKDKEMGFAMAVNLSVARLGSVINDQISPLAHDNWSLAGAIWIGAMLVGFCLLQTILLGMFDNHFFKKN
eukprot:UN33366